MKKLFLILVLGACASEQKIQRLLIEEPLGTETQTPRNLVYKVEGANNGERSSMLIPLSQMPQNLVVDDQYSDASMPKIGQATEADKLLSSGKLPEPTNQSAPSVSYLQGIETAQKLYQEQKYERALMVVSPLIEQYPTQTKLYLMQGTLYRKLGNKKLAYQAFKKASDLDPSNAKTQDTLIRMEAE